MSLNYDNEVGIGTDGHPIRQPVGNLEQKHTRNSAALWGRTWTRAQDCFSWPNSNFSLYIFYKHIYNIYIFSAMNSSFYLRIKNSHHMQYIFSTRGWSGNCVVIRKWSFFFYSSTITTIHFKRIPITIVHFPYTYSNGLVLPSFLM